MLNSRGRALVLYVGFVFLCAIAAQAAPFAYISNGNDNTVSIIDLATNVVVKTVTVGTLPWGVAANPAGTHVYIVNRGSNNVSVIDTSTDTVIATVSVGTNPYGAAINAAGTRVYVANGGSNSVSVIDTSTNTVVANVPIGTSPYGVAVNPAGTRVYATDYQNSNVSVIDTTSNTVLTTIGVGSVPTGVAVNPAGTRVFVVNNYSNTVSVIDANSNTVVATVPVNSSPYAVAINPAGSRAYVTNEGDNDVSVIDTTTNTVLTTVAVGPQPLGVAIDASGTHVYAANGSATNISVINSASNTVAATVNVGSGPIAFGQFIGAGPSGPPPPGLGFFPITPCRIVDTRTGQNKTGAFGPPSLIAGGERTFPLTSSACGLPGSAEAFSLNFTAVPSEPLPYLSVWPAGQSYPGVSTLNSTDASTLANAAIVPSGTSGSITTLSGGNTDLIIDTNGYFASPNGSELAFYPLTPCRVADTRSSQPFSGPFGPPSLFSGEERNFPIQTSSCDVPVSASAYSLNVTAVPEGPLPYLSVWPTGQSYPNVSTLNSNDGSLIANAAIVPAGSPSGSIRILSGGNTDLIIDINGYFGPSGAPGALHFYTLTPCRVADTRASQGFGGPFGPPAMAASSSRDFPILSGACSVPLTAKAYSLNITAVPQGGLPYLSIWPAGQGYPNVSTLNSPKGTVLANAAIVPAGTPNGGITILAGGATDVIIDINGYFAP